MNRLTDKHSEGQTRRNADIQDIKNIQTNIQTDRRTDMHIESEKHSDERKGDIQ